MTQLEQANYEMMVELGIATEEELDLARHLVAGSWGEVIDAVCYIKTGYRTFAQFFECEIVEIEEN